MSPQHIVPFVAVTFLLCIAQHKLFQTGFLLSISDQVLLMLCRLPVSCCL
jgi:hypothetical protein